MGRLTDDALAAILRGCDGVTPGPYLAREMVRNGEVRGYFVQAPDVNGFAYGAELLAEDEYRDIDGKPPGIDRWKADANHIARLDPQTVASICRELLSLRESHPIEDGEGWVLVPREPTEAMLAAFHQGFRQHLGLRHKNRFKPPHELTNKERESAEQAGLRAMLAAAPSNPGTSKVENSRST